MNKPLVNLWCDGSCPKPGGAGGWAFILILPETGMEKIGSDGLSICTNNIAELRGCIDGLKILPTPCRVEVFSDSEYVCLGLNNWRHGWKKNNWQHEDFKTKKVVEVKNKALWIELDGLCRIHEVHANHVRGHTGVPLNERCDVLAGEAMKKFR